MDGRMMRPSAHRLTPKRAMIKVPVDNAAGTGAGLHLLLSSWRAIVTSDVRDLDSIGRGCHGVRRIAEFAMLDDAPRDGLAREVGHAPDRLSPIAVILINAFKIPPFERAVVAT